MDVLQWVTIGLAAYAAIVATVGVAWTSFGVWRDKTSVKVEALLGIENQAPGGRWLRTTTNFNSETIRPETLLVIAARNNGRRTVVLSQGGIRFSNGNMFLLTGQGMGTSFPKNLSEGESSNTFSYLTTIRQRIKQENILPPFWACWKTQTDQVYKSKIPKKLEQIILGN